MDTWVSAQLQAVKQAKTARNRLKHSNAFAPNCFMISPVRLAFGTCHGCTRRVYIYPRLSRIGKNKQVRNKSVACYICEFMLIPSIVG
jgi:hypothetical protein